MKASKGRSDRALGTQEGHATWCEGEGAAKGSRQETTSSRMAGEIRGTWVTAYGLRDGIRKARPSGGCGCKKGLERGDAERGEVERDDEAGLDEPGHA